MSTTAQAIEIIDGLVEASIPKPLATKLLDFVDKQREDRATKKFVKQEIDGVKREFKQEIDGVKREFKQEIDGIKREFKQEIDGVKRDVKWLKWILGLGLGGLLTVMLYLHSDTKAEVTGLRSEIRENRKLLLQILQKR